MMSDPRDVDNSPSTSASALRPGFPLGRSLPGRTSLNSPPPPPGRLSSLRSRDLTLGGFKKKTFVPNVHSIRKTKDELKEETHTAPKKEKREREERSKEHRGRRRERPQTIQSHSIFEQGPADTFRKIGSWERTELSESGLSPVLKCIKKEKRTSEDDEDEILQKLHRDDFLDDPGLKNDARNRPIQLPLYKSSDFFNASEPTTHIKEEASFDCTSVKAAGTKAQRQQPPTAAECSPAPQQPSVAELFQRLSVCDEEALLFIQLPDSMPGQPAASAEKPAKKESKAEDLKRAAQAKARDPVGKEGPPVLSDFSEGLIGKLQIRKSGKVQLLLGEVALDVSEGAAFSFLQQLVSVRLSEGLTGEMSVLGNVKHKLVCSPDFELLLQDVARSSAACPGNG
ncbi:DNA-directed RNA polymerase III subunit RPC4 [Paramormyrops kingsleyae]|uniref:Zgc:171971 n=1 Tax=Paramormyrops kingsleyae TaxID=1676925 RepID=A0A3B3QYX0_9TELE|nr:DNA-directed RNA polymerase III subunit RPC4-like [Paramormyrops kingsleyae]